MGDEAPEEGGGHSRQNLRAGLGKGAVLFPRTMKGTDVFHLEVGWRGEVRHNPICILTWILLAIG